MSVNPPEGTLTIENSHLDVKGNVSAVALKLGTLRLTPSYGLDAVANVSNSTTHTLELSNATTGLVTTANVVVGGHILPSGNELSDLGAPDNKFRDLYISDNSLWVGDTTKIAFSGGKMRFRKRKTNIVPAAVTNVGGNQSAALAHAGKAALTDMKLEDWRNYGKSLNTSLEVSDIFTDTDADYEVDEVVNTVYPVGSIYLSVNATNPGSLPSFAGTTWVRYAEGKCLFGVDDADTDFALETTGGVKEVVLTEAQMPVHTHGFFDNQRNFRTAWVGFVPQGGNQQEHYISQDPDTTNPAGGFNGITQPFNNMPPYIAIHIWKRTA
jgi:hypothetical protein